MPKNAIELFGETCVRFDSWIFNAQKIPQQNVFILMENSDYYDDI